MWCSHRKKKKLWKKSIVSPSKRKKAWYITQQHVKQHVFHNTFLHICWIGSVASSTSDLIGKQHWTPPPLLALLHSPFNLGLLQLSWRHTEGSKFLLWDSNEGINSAKSTVCLCEQAGKAGSWDRAVTFCQHVFFLGPSSWGFKSCYQQLAANSKRGKNDNQ